MKQVTAQVIDRRIEVPPEIEDGSQVAILATDDEEPLVLSPGEEQELSAALAEIDAGRYVDGWALLDELQTSCSARVELGSQWFR